ncbi:MAG: trypsin-like peptidase domain-containing protein [Anaerolineaceae bacterium]|nr:trypsin-like peptidase domain-containing protein [Anaerolineaceae bacterium]
MNNRYQRQAYLSFFLILAFTLASCSSNNSPQGPASAQFPTIAPIPTIQDTGLPTRPAPASSPAVASPPVAIPVTSNAAVASAPPVPLAAPGDFASSIRQVAQMVKPAIVQITNQQLQIDQFNRPFTVPAGVGSGVIYDARGHVLTNNHVVEGAQKLLVSLPDGRSFPANIVGADPQSDLAVVQIKGDNLPVAQLGDSTQLQVGDWVVAIGNALALPGGPTVSAGVVSALGRSVQEPGGQTSAQGPLLFDLIQTDAPINPGNSGGALVNLAGQVIGINTLVAGQAEPGVQAQGIGFAISIATAKPVADALVANGRVVHAYLGIEYQPLNPAISAQLGIRQTQGAIIGNVVPGSPADAAGLQPNDVVTAIDNQPLKDESDLAKILSAHKPGDVITLSVDRGNKTGQVKVTLGEAPTG